MHPHLKSLLVKAGCAPEATDDDAQKFYEGMSADKKADIDAKLAKLIADDAAGTAGTGASAAAGTGLSAADIAKIATTAALAAVSAVKRGEQSQQQQQQQAAKVDDDDAALAAEEARSTRIRKLGALHKVPEAKINMIVAENGTFEQARQAILKHLHETAKPLASVSVGDDQKVAALRTAIPQALIMRAGVGDRDREKQDKVFARLGEKRHELAEQLSQQSMLSMFRVYLIGLGVNPSEVHSLSNPALANSLGPRGLRQRFTRVAALAESTADFANITLDAINKTLRFNYLDAKRTWPIWCEKRFANDFKTINAVVLSEAPSMVSADESAEVKYVTLSDGKETSRLVTYKAGIRLTRNAIINDDMNAFNAIPRAQANSAARLEDDNAYALLTANGTMADTGALFNATAVTTAGGHANYTSSGGLPSVANLQVGATAIKKQKGLANAARLELEPKFLLVPSSIEEGTKELIGSKTLIAQYTGGSTNPTVVGDQNPFFNRYQVVGSTRLDDNSATAWYLLADYRDGQINTFALYFLTDEPEPVLKSETDFDTDDVKYLVRHNNAGLVNDFRGAYKNNGQ
jgi:hypothetical protein